MDTETFVVVLVISLVIVISFLKNWLEAKFTGFDSKIISKIEGMSNKSIAEGLSMAHETSFKELSKVLEPIREKLQNYESKMDKLVKDEAVERSRMTEMIRCVTDINLAFADEAKTFTKAMRGDIRALGKFGEDKAELALIASGLHEGTDYLKQEVLAAEAGNMQPDFAVKLANNRAVFVDAKMSLDSFMKYLETENEDVRKVQASELVKRINSHVNDLSKKEYHKCTQFKSMDYVLMFIGSDRAISLALDVDSDIQRNALKKGILIVGPTTLMCSLKSIEFLWREERQVENLKEISELGGHLYTKLVYFVQNLKDSQKAFEKSQQCLRTALDHLNRGDKSILADAEKLNELGRFSQKVIPEINE